LPGSSLASCRITAFAPLPPLQFDKATADAAEFKAGFDKLVVDAVEQKAQVRLNVEGWRCRISTSLKQPDAAAAAIENGCLSHHPRALLNQLPESK
jgi:hypothetical protein